MVVGAELGPPRWQLRGAFWLAAVGVGLYLALVASPMAANDRARVSADATALIGHAWLFENGRIAVRDFSAAWGPLPQLLARGAVALVPGGPLDAAPLVFFVLRAAGVVTLVTWVVLLPWRRAGAMALPLAVLIWTLQSSAYGIFRVGVALLALRASARALAPSAPRSGLRVGVAGALLGLSATASLDVFVYAVGALVAGTVALAAVAEPRHRRRLALRAGAVLSACAAAILGLLVLADLTAADPTQGLLAPATRAFARAATFSQVFGKPVAIGVPAIAVWGALVAVALAGTVRALRREADPLRVDLALLAPFALLSLKSAITRGDVVHLGFGLTPLLALLALLAAGAKSRPERLAQAAALVCALLIWPAPTLARGLPARESADPARAWSALRQRSTSPELLPVEAIERAGRRGGPLFVFPLQTAFAAAAGRPPAAPFDQVYGAHTPEMQERLVEGLRSAGPELEVLYGLDGLPTWRVDGVQSITRSPVVAEHLLREFRRRPRRLLDGGFVLLSRRRRPRELAWVPLPFRLERGDGGVVQLHLEPAVRCGLLRVGLELHHPAVARLGWSGGLRARLAAGGRTLARSRVVALRAGAPFRTLLSPLDGAAFAALFEDAQRAHAPRIDRLILEPEPTGPFGVAPAHVGVLDLACLGREAGP